MIAIAFPTLFEAQDLLASLQGKQEKEISGVRCFTGLIGKMELFVIICGIGGAKAAASVSLVLPHSSANMLILAGFAGALNPTISKGQVIVAARYSSDSMLNFLKAVPGYDVALMCSSDRVISTPAEKAELAESSGCQIVDMETARVAEVAASFGLEIIGVRAISDDARDTVPAEVLACGYDQETSKTTPMKLGLHLIFHPKDIPELKRFLQPLPEVRRALTRFLIRLINEFEEV